MDLELTGRRALVTGGSRGIGLAIGRALAHEGVDVALVGRDRERLVREAERLSAETGRNVVGVVADTGSDASVTAMAAEAAERLGGIDILVNGAATPRAGGVPAENALEESLGDEMNVKPGGYLRCIRAVAPGMVERGWGRIINIGGTAVRQSGAMVASLRTASVVAMTKNLADELGPSGVNVTVLHPGWTRTERTAGALERLAEAQGVTPAEAERARAATVSIGRLVTAEELAVVAVFLASPRSVAINGDAIFAGGGVRGSIHY